MTLKISSYSKLPEIKLSLSSSKRFFSSLDPKRPKDFWKSIKALSTSPDNCSIPSLIDSATNNEVKDNGDKAEQCTPIHVNICTIIGTLGPHLY